MIFKVIYGMFGKYLLPVVLASLLATSAFAMIQTKRASAFKAKTIHLEATLNAYEEAAEIALKLREDNAALLQEKNYLLGKLANAKGFNDPLSDDFLTVFDELRQNLPSSDGSSR